MDILQITLFVLSAVSYASMTFLAGFAFVRMKRLDKDVTEVRLGIFAMMKMVTSLHLRSTADSINGMKTDLRRMVAEERFEDAERLKAFIEKSEKAMLMELEKFKEHFGEDSVHEF